MATPNAKSEVAKGTCYMILAALLFALGATAARFTSNDLNIFTIVFWTNLLNMYDISVMNLPL